MRSGPFLRARVAVAAAAWGAAALLAAGSLTASPAAADAGSGDSSVTVSGAGQFSALKVTVSQTSKLIDQVVHVTWTGGTPTQTPFAADYLQIMQCWGDDPAGPTRDHCEYGNSGDTRGGPQVTTRQLDSATGSRDPAETQVATPDNPYNYVPFESASWVDDPANPGHQMHPVVSGDFQGIGQYFDAQTSNEQPLNSTGADGTGESFFETMTAQEAPGLGCGSTTTSSSGQAWTPRCWLVIVPRGETEVTGAPSSALGSLVTTPLSATNWANRIVVPLQFLPIALACPIGSPELRTSGQEMVQEAAYRWQAQLCKQSGTVYSYAKGSDDSARRQLLSPSPGLDFITQPVPPTASGSSGVVYAPVAVSGAVIAFNIDYSAYASAALKPLAGQRVPDVNLTPRLVAKLITQSYRQGAPGLDPALADANIPQGLTYDPDFFAVNPGLTGLSHGGGDVLMPFSPSDITQELWSWINADAAARAFLDGTPDPWGMTVNPSYAKITDTAIPSSFPKQDPYCAPQPPSSDLVQAPPLCTLDYRPYANDMHDTARSAARGDTLARASWDGNATPPHYSKGPLQISGSQSVMAFTDVATANRYSLPVARLQNAAGQFVAPTATSLAASLAAMTPSSVAGVLQPNPEATDPAAYPLTSITYAATVPSALTPSARSDYADFLQYAVTAGQTPGLDLGQLPFGYAPLTPALVAQALATSVGLKTYVAPTTSSPVATPPPTSTPTKQPSPQPAKPRPSQAKPPSSPSPSPSKSKSPSPAPASTYPATAPPLPAVTTQFPTTAPSTTAVSPTNLPPPDPRPVAAATATPATPSNAASSPSASATEATEPISLSRPTPAVDAGGSKYVVIVVLAIGGLCALSGPTLLRFGSRRPK